MDDVPVVSIITATYHWPEALRHAIRSVLDQTFTSFEHIVVGDGCTGETEALVRSIDDSRVHWINLPTNTGNQAFPNATGLRAARGRLIAYLGHDDLWLPNHLETLVAALDEADADLTWSVATLFGEDSAFGITGVTPPVRDEPFPFAPPSSLLHRRDVADAVGGWGDPDSLAVPFDHEFGERLWRHRYRAAPSGRMTTLKFPATWFPDSYVHQTARVQADAAQRMARDGEAFAEAVFVRAIQSVETSRFVPGVGASPAPSEPGAQVRANRLRKGATRFTKGERLTSYRLDLSRHVHALREWHGPERHETFGDFQWTGPSTTTTLHAPLDRSSPLRLSIQVMASLAPFVFDSLRLRVDDVPLEAHAVPGDGCTVVTATIPAATLSDPAPATRIVLEVAEVIRPSDLDPASTDDRELGLAISELVIEPASVTT